MRCYSTDVCAMMKKLNERVLSGFSFTATGQFIYLFINRVYGIGRLTSRYGPCRLSEISWLKEIMASIVIGLICGWIVYHLEKADKETHIPRIKFKNFGMAIISFSILFFGFIFIFVIREYNVYSQQVTYMFRRTFWQYCSAQIPWVEIVATSLIFGIILAIGFSTTEQKKSSAQTKGI